MRQFFILVIIGLIAFFGIRSLQDRAEENQVDFVDISETTTLNTAPDTQPSAHILDEDTGMLEIADQEIVLPEDNEGIDRATLFFTSEGNRLKTAGTVSRLYDSERGLFTLVAMFDEDVFGDSTTTPTVWIAETEAGSGDIHYLRLGSVEIDSDTSAVFLYQSTSNLMSYDEVLVSTLSIKSETSIPRAPMIEAQFGTNQGETL